ncbi:MAG: tetratricopeptide repeat protein [Gammaproteobacteria bacterium]|nr:tetratricopeptide repeat protein [Gammaproteobacteria bacterium]
MNALNRTTVFLALFSLASQNALAESPDTTLSMSVFNKLNTVEEFIGRQEYAKAQDKLSQMLKELPDKAADRAYVYYSQAMLFLQQENYQQALNYYKKSYELNALNEKTAASVAQMLGNLSLHFEQYQQAIGYLNEYIKLNPTPEKQTLFALGSAYYQLEQYKAAEAPLEQIMQQFDPDKSAYLLLFSAYYEQKKLNPATGVLERIIRFWPEESEHWLQLASLYLEQKKISKSLEVLQLAFAKKLLLKENELLQYVYALYEKGLPYKAARVLTQAFDNKQIERNYKNYSLLASLYVDAREDDLAFDAFQAAAEFAKDGKDDLYLAQLHYDRESWEKSITHAKKALNKGISNAGNAHMLIAASYHELDQTKEAKSHLEQASRHKKTREMARQWLARLE